MERDGSSQHGTEDLSRESYRDPPLSPSSGRMMLTTPIRDESASDDGTSPAPPTLLSPEKRERETIDINRILPAVGSVLRGVTSALYLDVILPFSMSKTTF